MQRSMQATTLSTQRRHQCLKAADFKVFRPDLRPKSTQSDLWTNLNYTSLPVEILMVYHTANVP
eukprot:4402056-Amphidinium_carterae.1